MQQPLLLLVLMLLVAGAAGIFLVVRRRRLADYRRRQQASGEQAPGDAIGTVGRGRPGWALPLIVLIGVFVLLGGYALLQNLNTRGTDSFVVLVAPFDDGGDGSTGRNIAASLARLLDEQPGELTAVVLDSAPADPYAAFEQAAAQEADLLVYGSVTPGGMLDGESLLPRLIYMPSGAYAPNGWAGYTGRFAMPRSYTLSSAPINGQAVLAPLLVALRDYSAGDVDLAYLTIEGLLADYPALSPPLPRAILGNVLWARGAYSRAADQYAQALAQPSDEQAMLANNRGAILLDAGETAAALDSFNQAIALLQGNDLGELRFNLGSLALADGRLDDAASDLEQARNLLPPSVPLLTTLATIYRERGQLAEAELALSAAEQQNAADVVRTAQPYRPMVRQRNDGLLREQRALLNLAEELEARGPLLWELEASPPVPPANIQGLYDSLRTAADLSEQEISRWTQRSAADAAAFAGTGQTATGQSERARTSYDRQRFYQSVLETELARSRRSSTATTLGRIFGTLFSSRDALVGHIALAREVDEAIPGQPAVLAQLARALRVAGELDEADQTYDRVIALANTRPEGYFGKGLVALDRGDRAAAVAQFTAAYGRDPRFFPAPQELARLAEEQGDWQAAITQRRILAELRPDVEGVVALAQALRRAGGQANFLEAQGLLGPIAREHVVAGIELARLYNDAGRPDAAISAYRDALTTDPNSSTAAFELGETLARQGDLAGAETSLRDALRIDENNIDARLALARLYAGPLEEPVQAREEYAILLRQNLSDVPQLIAIGDNALAAADYPQAIAAYERALRLSPDDTLTHHKISEAYLASDRIDSAAQATQRVLDATAAAADSEGLRIRAEALARMGDVARLRGEIGVANDYYAQAQGIDPNLIDAQLGLGLSSVGQGNWGVARGYFETATRLEAGQSDPQAWFWLAESQLRAGDLAPALDNYLRSLELKPQFPEPHLGIAQLRETQGDVDGALVQIDEALRQRPNYAEALLFRGKLLQRLGRSNEALVAYDSAIRANGRIAETYYRRAIIYISNEENGAAVRDLQQAVRLQPNFPEAHYWLGQALYSQGRLQNALNAFREAIGLNPNYIEAIYYSGRVAEDLGLRPDAISAYQTVIQLDAGGEWGQLAQTQLDQLG